MKISAYIVSLFMLIRSFMVDGQLITTPGSPVNLVQNVLLGPGVTVSNIKYTGNASAIGQFSANGTNLGISSGIVLTTGTILDGGAGPHGPNNQADAGVDNEFGGSGILTAIVGENTYNAALLEFDFVPYADTVRFKYVFGSEEYPEFAPPITSSFNDVFAFFISGPGIVGNQNMARLPNGSIVSINNVNKVTNPSFFKENGDGTESPYNASPMYIQYDGFTQVLTAWSKVECGKTYHLIIAIADVGDGIFDSGIFLEANSLSSKTPVDISYKLSGIAFPSKPNQMAEGCVSATVTLTRSSNLSSAITIPVSVSGTAVEGLDFSDIPNAVTIPAGEKSLSFTIDALPDALAETDESLSLAFQLADPCGNVNPIVIDLSIGDVQPVGAAFKSDTVVCPGSNIQLIAIPSGGVGPYTYRWSTGETSPTISVNPSSSQTYTVEITDHCLKKTAVGSGTVNVPNYLPIEIDVSNDILEICPFVPRQLEAIVSGGAGNYTYAWSEMNGKDLGNQSTQIVKPSQTTVYIIVVKDKCGKTNREEVVYTVTSPPLIVTMSPDAQICPGDSARVEVTARGGYGKYAFDWLASNDTTSFVWFKPVITTSYSVDVSDECQTFKVRGSATITVVKPKVDFSVISQTLFDEFPITFQNLTLNGNTYSWNFGDGNTSTLANPSNVFKSPGDYDVMLVAIDKNGCIDTIVKRITIEEAYFVYVPNAFTPDGFNFNEVFKVSALGVKELKVRIFDRWGELIFESNDPGFQWDGKFKGQPVQDGIYIWKLSYKTNSGRDIHTTGHINCLR